MFKRKSTAKTAISAIMALFLSYSCLGRNAFAIYFSELLGDGLHWGMEIEGISEIEYDKDGLEITLIFENKNSSPLNIDFNEIIPLSGVPLLKELACVFEITDKIHTFNLGPGEAKEFEWVQIFPSDYCAPELIESVAEWLPAA